MKKKLILRFLFISIILVSSNQIYSQCTNSSSYGSATAPTTSATVTISTCNYQTEYSTISSVVSGNQYQVTNSLGGYITVRRGSYNGTVVASGNSPLTWTATASGTHYIHYNTNSSCGTASSCCVTTISCVSCGGGGPVTPAASTCPEALPFCTSDSYTFPASTNVSSLGSVGCLSTTPNPAWYWMQIGNPGNIDIYMSSGGDVDFIAWGPFTSLSAACASNLMSNSGVDCSYSTAAQETANLTNTQTGQVYVLLITNYANITTNISFSQTGGSGSTNCGIIAPPIINNGPLCAGQTLQLTVSNPTTGASYLWTGPGAWSSTQMNPTITNVTTANAGVYSLVITVGANTSPPVTTTVVINPNITPTFASSGPYCSGTSISALPTSSTNGITGTWSPAICNTATTNYTFTPTAGLCAVPTNSTIVINDVVEPTFASFGPYCAGTSIPALPTTSQNGYTGTWSPAISNTESTNYTFTPTAGQCASNTTTNIDIDSLQSAVLYTTNQFCDAMGAAEVTGIGGTPSYTYIWPSSAMGISGGVATQLVAGNYSVTISDVQGCSAIQSLNVDFTNNMTASTSLISNPLCFDDSNGSGNVIVQHGSSPYNIAWGGGNGVSTISPYVIIGLASGVYNITITDNSGCIAHASLTLNQPPKLIAAASFTPIPCYGDDSHVTVTATGGTPSYTGIGTFTSLSGNHSFTVSDQNNCLSVCSVNIPAAPSALSLNSVLKDVTCFGKNNGTISLVAAGGTHPYTYLWSNSLSGASIANLSHGIYDVVIRDINGCSLSESFTINEPPQINFTFVSENVKCFGANTGKLEMSAFGGLQPYTFNIHNPVFSAAGASHDNLSAGNYTVMVNDVNACSVAASLEISSPSQIELSVITNDPTCIGNNDGSVEIVASGGTSPYMYVFDETMFDIPIVAALKQGFYNLRVIDANNCIKELNNTQLSDIQVDCITIPNAFTPNGDNVNDTWEINNIEKFPDAIIQVYNRWGQAMYYASPDDENWNGVYNGKLVPAGSYVYMINLYNGKKSYTGTVTVVH